MKIDRADQLVKAAIAQVQALEFAVGVPLLCSLVAVLIFLVEQSPGKAHLGTLMEGLWFKGRGVGGGRRGAGRQKEAQIGAAFSCLSLYIA